ncbi:hypothetical protein MRX96_056141 [Rhipicephalus microplus]
MVANKQRRVPLTTSGSDARVPSHYGTAGRRAQRVACVQCCGNIGSSVESEQMGSAKGAAQQDDDGPSPARLPGFPAVKPGLPSFPTSASRSSLMSLPDFGHSYLTLSISLFVALRCCQRLSALTAPMDPAGACDVGNLVSYCLRRTCRTRCCAKSALVCRYDWHDPLIAECAPVRYRKASCVCVCVRYVGQRRIWRSLRANGHDGLIRATLQMRGEREFGRIEVKRMPGCRQRAGG